MAKQRSILLFEQAIKTEATLKTYMFQLSKFRKFYSLKDFDSILTIDPKKLQVMLEDYLFDIKKRLSPSSVPQVFFPLELFFSMNDVIINFKKIRKMFPAGEKISGSDTYTDDEIRKIVDICKTKKHRALIHFIASSGVRIGSITDLKVKHLKEMPKGCKSVLVYGDTKDEYTTFLTPEASKHLDNYFAERGFSGELINEESPVFRTDRNKLGLGKAKPMTEQNASITVRRIVDRAIKRIKASNTRYTIQSAHGFRKRFNTILKSNNDVNPNLAEKMMGHSVTIQLDNNYLVPNVNRMFDEYVKVIPELTISEAIKLKEENKLKDEKIKSLESDKDRRIDELEKKFDNVERLLDRIDSKK